MNEAKEILKKAYLQKLKVQGIEREIMDQRKINKESRANIIRLSDSYRKEQEVMMNLITNRGL